ncbi:histone deacetylase [Kitasatospora sp. NPDC048407]|uniref:histone deacetylase n=1 Tax=Kitasatospora sp. NPDC048407 TaxID=3364051 RepID=UPI0037143C64
MDETRPRPAPIGPGALVWYAAYGSNMSADRLARYLTGGRPTGAARTHRGSRDRTPPARSLPIRLPGILYFAHESPLWGGGIGFYDPSRHGEMPARAHLLTAGQFSDIAAQEMRRESGAGLDLTRALTTGRDQLGPSHYEMLLRLGSIDGIPVLTFTSPWTVTDADLNPPSAAYLIAIATGLAESHGWTPAQSAVYLATRPGATVRWTPRSALRAIGSAFADPSRLHP